MHESVFAVKSFLKGLSVTAETVFNAITREACSFQLSHIYSVMADTTALNKGKKSGVNARLVKYFNNELGHDIHTLECMFHTNEIYLYHVISYVDGRKRGPGAMQDGALLNLIALDKPSREKLTPANQLDVPVTRIAAVHLRAKLEWFFQKKSSKVDDNSFRNDQLCMLVLACYIIAEVPDNLKNLLFYKQEKVCHSRWITTANEYMRTLIFNSSNLTATQKAKLQKIVSYIISVYVPSFLMIHLHPKTPEGPFLCLFQRDLLCSYFEIEPNISEVAMKYFLSHASQWLSWKNVALSVFAEVAPYTAEAVKTSESFPTDVDVCALLQDRSTLLKQFFTAKSKEAPCITTDITPMFWKSIENHNRSTERRIGRLKGLINNKVQDDPTQLSLSDLRLRAHLCNMEISEF